MRALSHGGDPQGVRGPRVLMWLALMVLGLFLATLPRAEETGRSAVVLEISGAIGPASSDYLRRGLDRAQDTEAAIVVVRMDTPGGLDTSMREMIRDILGSPVPVATFIHPSGARAASAGTYILYASHIAAMAPGTNLGAATPVQVGGGGLPFGQQEEDEDEEEDAENDENGEEQTRRAPRDAMEAKLINDAVAYIRSLAELRDRNADWAERAVREAASLSASDAAAENVIDFVARSVEDVLEEAHGRTVTVAGDEVTLDTEDLAIDTFDPDWRTRLLGVITNPNVALILMMIGVYGLIFEFMNPGALYPGTIGAISLIIGLYSLAVLPVNYAGVGLILLGVALMVAEAFAPSFGILGIGGAAAFVLGALILIDTDAPGFQMSWEVVGGVAVISLALSLAVVRLAVSSHKRQVVSGREHMIGATAQVVTWEDGEGFVFVHGERWKAVSAAPLEIGQRVRVIGVDGLTLKVAPEEPGEK